MSSNIYETGKIIGKGEFGHIIKARHKITNDYVAIKQNINSNNLLLYESKIIKALQTHKNIIKIKWYGKINNISSLVTELLSYNLDEISQKGVFSENLLKIYGKQMISAIQHIHSKGYIHRDIKPDNFMIKSSNKREICLIDFGLARKYIDVNGNHVLFDNNVDVIGSFNYCSRNMHKKIRPSRRDDVESMLYVFLKLLVKTLPWNNLHITDKNEKNDIFYSKKNNILNFDFNNFTCKNLIYKILKMIKYIQNIGYFDEPDYDKLYTILI